MALSDELSRLSVRARDAEEHVAAAKKQARDQLAQNVAHARQTTQTTAEKLRGASAAAAGHAKAWVDRAQHDPAWRDNVTFHEYFHGDNAAGLGATHQTGWTGIVADIIRRRHGMVTTIDAVLLRLGEPRGRR
jgi:hypothetical protein